MYLLIESSLLSIYDLLRSSCCARSSSVFFKEVLLLLLLLVFFLSSFCWILLASKLSPSRNPFGIKLSFFFFFVF